MTDLAARVYRLYLAHPEGAVAEAGQAGKGRAMGQSWLAERVGVTARSIRRQIARGRFTRPVELHVQRLEAEAAAATRPEPRRRRTRQLSQRP